MKVKCEKELKYADTLEVGDHIKVGGVDCDVVKVESVFHHTPNARTRLELKIVGATTKKSEMILLLPHKTPITILK